MRGRGFEVGKNQYLLIENDELEAVTIESNHTIEIDSFVPASRWTNVSRQPVLPCPERAGRPGGVRGHPRCDARQGHGGARQDRSGEARTRRNASAVGKGLVGTTLRYPYEVRDTKDYFDDIPDMKLPKDMLQLAEHILETKAGDFEPEKFEDRYENAVVEMIQRKRAGMPVPTERIAAPAPNVVSLMDALKRSLATEAANAAEHPEIKRRSQRSVLLVNAKCCCPLQAKEQLRRPQKSRLGRPRVKGRLDKYGIARVFSFTSATRRSRG